MLELSAEQLEQLDHIRQDEVIDKLLLEVRQQDPAWFAKVGEPKASAYLRQLRDEAKALGIEGPEETELFMRYGLYKPGFQQSPEFVEWMQRPVADTPEQRFRDYDSVMQYVDALKEWPRAR
ncbi:MULTISPECIES: hypothetical protein [unclassified Pseudomonas]|uniref:hypothetical protein n=1 Tax=unclassified Pseudomonas TaxID=196821 RepID=UPI001CBED495|nr:MULTISPECIES: hypothetical protein [unclassified Pseudomonas]